MDETDHALTPRIQVLKVNRKPNEINDLPVPPPRQYSLCVPPVIALKTRGPQVKGVWKYLYRAVDKEGKTVDFLLTARRDKAAAMRFFDKAMKASGAPEKVTMDKSGANKAALDDINGRGETSIIVRQVKYLNNIVEQDHRAIKRVTKPMLNFKSFRAARNVLAGIELMHMIRKGQLLLEGSTELSFADQFYALAGKIRPV